MTAPDPTAGERLIRAERQRQIAQEGYTSEHDREHGGFALSQAAYCYKAHGLLPVGALPDQWPWDRESWKPRDPISNLIRAGALYLAAAEAGYPGATESAQQCAALLDASIARLAPASPPAVAASMGTSEDVEALAKALHDVGIERGYVGADAIRKHWAERLLASDWLAYQLAAAEQRGRDEARGVK